MKATEQHFPVILFITMQKVALTLDTVDEKGKKTKLCQFALYCSQRMRKDKGDNATGFTSPNQMMRKFELKKGFNGDIMIRDLGFFY